MRRAVYAGSFDPLTLGHLWMIEQGARLFDELVVAIGTNPEKRYRFEFADRMAMLRDVTSTFPNVRAASFENLFLVNYAKEVDATFILRGIRNEQDYGYERGMRYVNGEFDGSVQTVFLIPPRELVEVSSSFVKGLIGPSGWRDVVRRYVPKPVYQHILASTEPEQPKIHAAEDGDRASVRSVWNRRCAERTVRDERLKAIDPILDAYSAGDRHYHNLHHIAATLRELASLTQPIPNRSAIEIALAFHDCVYDAKRSDNEERSADLAAQLLQSINEPANFIDDVRRLILATRHTAIPTQTDEQMMVDIDLAILGQLASAFDEYERAIRREYAHVPEADFRAGRTTLLKAFLARPKIFSTVTMQERYELAARENLHRSIESLSGSIASDRFKKSMIIGFDQWHDGLGYDLDALKEMSLDERKAARITLHHKKPRDWRDVEALQYLRDLGDKEAAEGIRDALQDGDTNIRLRAAEALHEAGEFPEIDIEVANALKSPYADSSLVKTLLMAEQHPTAGVKKALLWAVKNGPGRVAVNCAGMLFYLCGVSKEPFDWDFRPFFLRFLPDNKSDREAAFIELCEKTGMDPKDAA